MKYYSSLILVFLSFFFFSCEQHENALITTENDEIVTANLSIPQVYVSDKGLTISQTIDGKSGGSISFDSSFVNNEGDTIKICVKLTILPNSFIGLKEIQMIPKVEEGSIQFFPEMVFDKKLQLDLSYTGLDLANLGYNQNSQIDFVYQADNGNVEFLSNNGCKVIWNQSKIFVQNALLQHFSRYAFVRKSC